MQVTLGQKKYNLIWVRFGGVKVVPQPHRRTVVYLSAAMMPHPLLSDRKASPLSCSQVSTAVVFSSFLQLFERDPTRRLGVVGDIRVQPFFKSVNWNSLERREVEPPFKPKVVREPSVVMFSTHFARRPRTVAPARICTCILDSLSDSPAVHRNPPVTAATLTESS